MVVMLIVLVGLGTIAGLTVISVQGGSATTNTHRFNAMALYAAESGVAVTMDWMRNNAGYNHPTIPLGSRRFSPWVNRYNASPVLAPVPGNAVPSGGAGNLLSTDQRGWYEVVLLNNESDEGLPEFGGYDTDGVVVIQATGHGPNGAVAKLEVEVYCECAVTPPAAPPPRKLVLLGWRELL